VIRIPYLRWQIAGLLALATALSYFDRQSFAVVVGEVRKDVTISSEDYGWLTSLFLLAYAAMYAVGGRIIDQLGTRVGLTAMIVWWSAATFLTGLANSLLGLGVCRFLLGMGEGGGFPGSAKAVAEWFPPRQRAMAFGIFNTGSSVGAVAAPPLIAIVVAAFGWRWVFFLTGIAGFVWALVWIAFYRTPDRHPLITPAERDMLEAERLLERPATSGADPSWWAFFAYPEVLGLMLAKGLSDSAWFFFIFWLPKYLLDVHEFDIKEIGEFAWIPYAFAGAGSLAAGLFGWLLRYNFSMRATRLIVLAASAALLPASTLIPAAPVTWAIVLFSMCMFGHQCFSTTMQTLPADLFRSRVVGTVGGLLGSAGAFAAMLFSLLGGWIVEHHGYGPVFVVTGLLHPVAFVVILLTVRNVAPLDREGNESANPAA
jgi:ACS family hexuronate transporter-like MFS transporter